ncbi:hypothetical protein DIURU_004369 [Diutina rugosa]|uniref:F-box protein Hrt3/FBXO9 C-terminal domain-containing protein n=1 Tax=Diutina rugosa TaxID=5481 RepID=A0A642UHP4_DIURU|nr:uncharacterized protein DIURU_004369 [Diutina rugosa]KAA8899347.1 hypothetical protein DIURU_004369 [Diutina rugosa]
MMDDTSKQAVALFEQAADKESHGHMSDALSLYRQAYKLHEHVDQLYRAQMVPAKIDGLRQERGKNAGVRVDDDAVSRIDVDKLLRSFENVAAEAPDGTNDDSHLTIKLAKMGLEEDDEIVDLQPISPLEHLPEDVWMNILEILVATDPVAWFKWSICCKRHAYLGLSDHSTVWRQLCYLIYPKQHWAENVYSRTLADEVIPSDLLKVLPQYDNSWKVMLKTRPFIKFLGCYISAVNFYSEGGKSEFSSSWTNPVKITTYYRYLRFYPDGMVAKVRTSLEPTKVVPQLSRHNQSVRTSALPESGPLQVVKDPHMIQHGRWTISSEGRVVVTIDNANKYYRLDYTFDIKSIGGLMRHAKLSWNKCVGTRKSQFLNDDREGEVEEFSLRNEKPFKFSRVASYTYTN